MLGKIISFFVGDLGAKIGNNVANVAAIAALTPAVLALIDHKEETAVALSWGDLALFGGVCFVIIKIVQYTRSPADRW